MENNNDHWVEERLAMLTPPAEWQPDIPRALARFHERRSGHRTAARKWTWAMAAALAASASLLAFPAPRAVAQRIWAPCLEACAGLFTNKPGAPQAELRLSDYKGKVVLLNFWATWCPPCKLEMPWFAEFEKAYASQGFAVIGVAMDEDGWKSVKPCLEMLKIDYKIVLGDQSIAQSFGGVESLPATFLIDREGKIVARHFGIVSKNVYQDEIARLLAQ